MGCVAGLLCDPQIGTKGYVTHDELPEYPKVIHCRFDRQTDRIIKNFEQITLSKEDYEKISEIGKNNYVRFAIPVTFSPKWMVNVFDEAVEKEAQTEYAVKLE